jgi:hypothetical protein
LIVGFKKIPRGVMSFTRVFMALRYTSLTSAEPHLRRQVPNQPQLEGATAMTKLVLAAVAALSIIASPVFAGPYEPSAPTSYNGDFQLQGR